MKIDMKPKIEQPKIEHNIDDPDIQISKVEINLEEHQTKKELTAFKISSEPESKPQSNQESQVSKAPSRDS